MDFGESLLDDESVDLAEKSLCNKVDNDVEKTVENVENVENVRRTMSTSQSWGGEGTPWVVDERLTNATNYITILIPRSAKNFP